MPSEKTEKQLSAALARQDAVRRRSEAWQQVLKEDAAAARAEAEKTARLKALRLAREEADRLSGADKPKPRGKARSAASRSA